MSEMINTVIIDDEDNFATSLEILLRKNIPKISIIGTANSVKEGVSLIKKVSPNLVFLDINLPDGSGFEILEKTNNKSYEIIFTTAYSEFAQRAFEFSALHYLMKPLSIEKLKDAMERYSKAHDKDNFDEKLRILKESLIDKPQKILLPTSDGQNIFNISDIVRCEADDNYTNVHFINKKKFLISKPLQSFNRILNDLEFVRIHNKHLINLRYVKKYVCGRKPFVILTDNTELPLTQTYRTEFSERLKHFAKSF